MADIFDYLEWRGDLLLEQSPFNEVDGMLLSQLSYFPFEYLEPEVMAHSITIQDAVNLLLELPDLSDKLVLKEDMRLITELVENDRFGHMTLHYFEKLTDLETETQFCAVTIRLHPDLYFISFRGTDCTFVGWKEDFNMTYLSPVPAQQMAVEYLEKIAAEIKGDFIVAGHSKGGNLAVYASAFCRPFTQVRIREVYNYDGPGFNEDVLSTDGYQAICDKITTFVPQSSIVGLMLEHEEKYIIVHSSQPINLLQHKIYFWDIQRNHFEYLEEVTDHSRFLDSTIKSWIAGMDMEQREKFVDAIYLVLTETNLLSFKELGDNWFSNTKSMIKALKNLDEETRKAVSETLKSFMKTAKDSALKILSDRLH